MNYDINFSETSDGSGIYEGSIITTQNLEEKTEVTLVEDTETGASFYLVNTVTTGDLLLSVILLLILLFEFFKLVIARRIPQLTRYWK